MAHFIDPTVAKDYPVILGDGLLGNPSNEIFTGIRYNHKPELTSDAKLKPSVAGKTTSYDLSFNDPKGNHTFTGTRSTENDDYVLYFDPQRKAFILDKVDSTFDMNITRLPGNSSPEDLRRQYPHLEKPAPLKSDTKKMTTTTTTSATSATATTTKASSSSSAAKDKTKPSASKAGAASAGSKDKAAATAPRARKNEKKQQPKKFDLALPMPMPEQPKPESKPDPKSRGRNHKNDNNNNNNNNNNRDNDDDDDEEEEDDDGDLLVEYPGAENMSKSTAFTAAPALARPRRFDDFMDQRESEADDADGESDDEPRMIPKLPSPGIHHSHGHSQSHNHHGYSGGQHQHHHHHQRGQSNGHVEHSDDMEIDEAELEAAFENEAHADADGEADMEDELAKEMEEAFEHLHANNKFQGTQQYASPDGDESEISEED